ncbi:MAG: hypothetical protein AAFX93_08915 [Verrucomicrobiota bacterium]
MKSVILRYLFTLSVGALLGYLIAKYIGGKPGADPMSPKYVSSSSGSVDSASALDAHPSQEAEPATQVDAVVDLSGLFDAVDSREFSRLLGRSINGRDPTMVRAVSQVLVSEWSQRDPEASLEYVSGLEDGALRSDLLQIALKEYARAYGTDAIDWVNQHFVDLSTDAYMLPAIYSGLASNNPPQDVITMAEHLPEGIVRNHAVAAVIEEWARQDIGAVFDWIETQPLNQDLFDIYRSVMFRYIDQNPGDADMVILEMRESELKGQLAESFTRQLADQQSVSKALEWAEKIDNKKTRHNATWIALDRWSQQAPMQALEYALENYNTGQYAQLLGQMSENLARTDPVMLAAKINELPEAVQASSGEQVAQHWFKQDPVAAERWLYALPENEVKQRALNVAIDQYVNGNPSKAYELAESMSSDSNYWAHASKVVGQWYRVDPDSALAAVQTSARLDLDQKAALMQQLSPNEIVDILLPQ